MKRRIGGLILALAVLSSCGVAAAEVNSSPGLSTGDAPPQLLMFADGDPDPFAD